MRAGTTVLHSHRFLLASLALCSLLTLSFTVFRIAESNNLRYINLQTQNNAHDERSSSDVRVKWDDFDNSSALTTSGVPQYACAPCQLPRIERGRIAASSFRRPRSALLLHVSKTDRRTNNLIMVVAAAFHVAYRCRLRLVLDHRGSDSGFTADAEYSAYDFRAIPDGESNIRFASKLLSSSGLTCNNYLSLRGSPLNNALFYTILHSKQEVTSAINICVRWYLGVCADNYCRGDKATNADSLVMHVRQGDIFPRGFDAQVHSDYGQPPLSYYLSALHFQPWKRVTIVSEPTADKSPIILMMKNLAKFGTFKVPVDFTEDDASRTWHDDFRTLLCAHNIVTSRSTLWDTLAFGHGRNLFSYRCPPPLWKANSTVFRIPLDASKYQPIQQHTNSETEWLQMLLHSDTQPISQCWGA